MTTRRIGYARVSTRDPNPDLQRDALRAAGCDRVYEDTISGTEATRPGLAQALDQLRNGDTLVSWKLDRLGRSVKDLLDFAGRFNNSGIGFISLTDAINATTASGRFIFNVMVSLPRWSGSSCRTYPARPAGGAGTRQGRLPQTRHDGLQNPLRTKAPQPRHTAQGSRQKPRHPCTSVYRWVPATNIAKVSTPVAAAVGARDF
ncbi:Resolvase, N terminal domain [Arthrobacter sp. ok362]|nr:recombinase family protein [Arthrobacter sp. ok362]SDK47493.1 Resolvase, N terminal domain [Arthrobacter sp. ok362]